MIYWIQADWGGPVKIGYAQHDPIKRLRELQTGNPYKLVMRRVEPGDLAAERTLHVEFADDRLVGEWFAPTGPVCRRGQCLPSGTHGFDEGYAAGRASVTEGADGALLDGLAALANLSRVEVHHRDTSQLLAAYLRELTVAPRRDSVDRLVPTDA